MRPMLTAHILPYVDNPMNEDRWGDARAIADRIGWPRRGMHATLEALERRGYVESMRTADTSTPWSDKSPRLWRLTTPDNQKKGAATMSEGQR